MADAADLRMKLENGMLGAEPEGVGEAAPGGSTLSQEECAALLELLDAAAGAARAMEPIFIVSRKDDRKWWRVIPEVELAHVRLTKALEGIGPHGRLGTHSEGLVVGFVQEDGSP